jgi:hypothetical protein
MHKVETPFHVPRFKVFLHLTQKFNDPRSMISVLNYFNSRFSSASIQTHCSPQIKVQIQEGHTFEKMQYQSKFNIVLVGVWAQPPKKCT